MLERICSLANPRAPPQPFSQFTAWAGGGTTFALVPFSPAPRELPKLPYLWLESVLWIVGVGMRGGQPVPWPPALPFPSTQSQKEVYVHHERKGLALPPWHPPPDQTSYMGRGRAGKIHPNLCQACPRETLTYRLPASECWNRPFPGDHTRLSRKPCINKVLSSVEKKKERIWSFKLNCFTFSINKIEWKGNSSRRKRFWILKLIFKK